MVLPLSAGTAEGVALLSDSWLSGRLECVRPIRPGLALCPVATRDAPHVCPAGPRDLVSSCWLLTWKNFPVSFELSVADSTAVWLASFFWTFSGRGHPSRIGRATTPLRQDGSLHDRPADCICDFRPVVWAIGCKELPRCESQRQRKEAAYLEIARMCG